MTKNMIGSKAAMSEPTGVEDDSAPHVLVLVAAAVLGAYAQSIATNALGLRSHDGYLLPIFGPGVWSAMVAGVVAVVKLRRAGLPALLLGSFLGLLPTMIFAMQPAYMALFATPLLILLAHALPFARDPKASRTDGTSRSRWVIAAFAVYATVGYVIMCMNARNNGGLGLVLAPMYIPMLISPALAGWFGATIAAGSRKRGG
jgi:hypothetical protein